MRDDILDRLKSLMSDEGAALGVASNGGVAVKAAPKVKAPVVVPEEITDGVLCGVVVLDDGETFSNLRGCRVCFVPPDSDALPENATANSIDIDSLLTLRDAVKTILRIVQQ